MTRFIDPDLNALLPRRDEESKQERKEFRFPRMCPAWEGHRRVASLSPPSQCRGPTGPSGLGDTENRARVSPLPMSEPSQETAPPLPMSGPSQEMVWPFAAFSCCKNEDTEGNIRVSR